MAHDLRSAHPGHKHAKRRPLGQRTVMELFDVGPVVAITVLAGVVALLIAAIAYIIHSAPPTTISIASGPEGSAFYKNATKYAKILERNGVKVKVVPTEGSL